MAAQESRRALLRRAVEAAGVTVAPGVHDMVSARIADRLGFGALYMTGFGVTASQLGLPDAGLASYAEMEASVRRMASVAATPLIADGDTGYGGLLNVERTVRGYEAAGAAAIQLEDQVFPKKCGHTTGRAVIPAADMAAKVRVAVETREDPDFLIVARTDARTAQGLDEALRRAEAYAAAGADLLFIEAPESEDEMARIGGAFDVPLVANMVEGGRTPLLGGERLAELGYRVAIFPVAGVLAAAAALDRVYRGLADTGTTESQALYPFADFTRLVGFEDVWAFERRWAGEEE